MHVILRAKGEHNTHKAGEEIYVSTSLTMSYEFLTYFNFTFLSNRFFNLSNLLSSLGVRGFFVGRLGTREKLGNLVFM